ncbi:N-acetyldiaminopimelate deacetylase [Seinonella peptonophila]|uniref:N-acetyldiaminopimelate deacetylase n=1 Tax=Seinonella peptonophila TaxID=112248 RepID=UPI003BF5D0FD
MEVDRFIELRRQLHQIPELGFQEYKTQQLLLDYIQSLPQDRLELETWRTGILVKVPGYRSRQCIGYRTDIDGLPIEEQTDYEFRSQHPGHMHACGHDMHMAIALGLLTHFVHHPIQDDLLFIFQPAEEGPGGALPMLTSQPFIRWKPDQIFALHVAPEYPVGTISTRPGILFANTSELNIHLTGKSGHGAYPHQGNDMVVALTQLVTQLHSIVSRNVDPMDSVVLSIGKIEAGEKENIIAGHASLNGTIRTLSLPGMEKVKNRVSQILQGIQTSFQCEATLDWGSNYLQVKNDSLITEAFLDWARKETQLQVFECNQAMVGEDFGYFLEEIPGMMFWLGVDTPYGLHHPKLQPNEAAIPVAIQLLSQYFTQLSK